MAIDESALDQMQKDYNDAVEAWIAAIRHEQSLASTEHSVAEIDRWEEAADDEEEARDKVKAAKKAYEDGLRQKFFNF